jgi:hypothetical protein
LLLVMQLRAGLLVALAVARSAVNPAACREWLVRDVSLQILAELARLHGMSVAERDQLAGCEPYLVEAQDNDCACSFRCSLRPLLPRCRVHECVRALGPAVIVQRPALFSKTGSHQVFVLLCL